MSTNNNNKINTSKKSFENAISLLKSSRKNMGGGVGSSVYDLYICIYIT